MVEQAPIDLDLLFFCAAFDIDKRGLFTTGLNVLLLNARDDLLCFILHGVQQRFQACKVLMEVDGLLVYGQIGIPLFEPEPIERVE
jgi:hypothetical protein